MRLISRLSVATACLAGSLTLPCRGATPVVPDAPLRRSHLAAAYVRFDTLYALADLDAETERYVNRRFDDITGLFFRGETSAAIRLLGELSLTVEGVAPDPWAEALATSVMTITPPVIDRCDDEPVSIHIRSLADTPVAFVRAQPAVVRAVGADGRVLLMLPTLIGGLPLDIDVVVPPGDVPLLEAAAEIDLLIEGGGDSALGSWPIVCGSLDDVRRENERRLRALDPLGPLGQSIAACASRNALLNDRPSETRSTTQTLDLGELRDDVEREVAMLERGEDPYAHRAGDLWRTIRVGDADIAVRIYVPERLAGASDVPMVIALHGAGGDENLFPDAYGAGVIKDLADERGFILVSPQTRFFVANPEVFRAVIDVMASGYDIDRTRVFGVGHSLGAIALTSVASSMVDTLAGMACLAGPLVIRPPDSAPPTLLAAGELDPIAPPERLARYAAALQTAGVTVENVVYEDLGHTLMVNDALPDAVEWLFALSPN